MDLSSARVNSGLLRPCGSLDIRQAATLLGLFKTADMVCVPSRNEPFGIVILEAWSARKPVVATRNGGPAEFIRNEDTGVTVAAYHASIGEGVDVVLSDRTYGRRLGATVDARRSHGSLGK